MKQVLLGAGLLGNGGDLAGSVPRFLGPPYYLLNDTFTTDRAAGAVNGTDAEPGPGRRVVVDGNSKLSLSGGNLLLATGGALANPGLWWGEIARVAGRVLIGQVTVTNQGCYVGWDNNQSNIVTNALQFSTSTISARVSGNINVAAMSLGVAYQVAVILRTSGAFYFIKGGAFSDWILLYIGANSDTAIMYPSIMALSTTSVLSSDYLRVPATRWLPTPLVSDGFSSWGTSDGLGHEEGIAGGLGSGGVGLAMTAYVGTWGASGGVASCSILTSGVGLAGRDVGTADMIATVKVTLSGGVAGLFVRENADDRVMAVHDGTNAQLITRVSGVDTTLINVAATYVAGAELTLICEGQKFRLYYNNTFVGSEQTIADVSLQAETLAGIYTNNTANTFDDLVIYARGTGGEYSALDGF